jgi:outer membrane protein assembly factor BamB
MLINRATLLTWLCCGGIALAGENWPQFRGPDGQGHADSTGLPLRWSESQSVAWKTEIPGQGWSSPVVMDRRVWMTTATDEGRSLRAVCVDFESGRLLHDVEVFRRDKPIEKHATNSYASPTPVLETGRVYVHFGAMGTACLDAETAQVIWQNHDLVVDHQVGPGSSPALFEDLLLFCCDGTDVQYAAALDKKTGQLAWKTNRSGVIDKAPDQKKAFVTPLVIRADGRDLAIMVGAEWVYAYDPRSGQEIWTVKHPGFSVAPRPVFDHGLVIVSTGFMLPELFAIRPRGTGDLTASGLAWKTDKSVPTKPSPLVVGDELYLISDVGVLTCLDVRSGKQYYRHRLAGNFSASPIAADGRIYCCDEDGRTVVFAPGREYRELAANKLTGRFMASPAVVGNSLVLRTDTHLYRIDP